MASTIFGAIGRGYSARSILSAIGKKAPEHANKIANAYYLGYTANSILRSLVKNSEGKDYGEDAFLTARERKDKNFQSQKTKAYTQALAALGATGALTAGAYALMQANQSSRPELIIPPGVRKTPRKGQTIVQNPKALPYHEKKALQNTKKTTPPTSPQGTQSNQAGNLSTPIIMPMQSNQMQPQGQAQQTPTLYNPKTIDMIKNVGEEQRFKNIVGAGYDDLVTTQILRKVIPKNILGVMEQSEGGLEQIVKDYSSYLKEANQIQKQAQEQKIQEQKENSQINQFNSSVQVKPEVKQAQSLEPAEQVSAVKLPTNKNMQQANQTQQVQQPIQEQAPSQQKKMQPIAPVEQPEIEKPQPPSKPLVSLKNGKIGNVESVKNGVATVNIDGKTHKEKASNMMQEPEGVESAVREIVNSIPEGMKSTALQSMVHIPGMNVLLTQFYDGKWAWYKDVPEELYKSIALGTYEPKGQAKTGIAEYKPGVSDSRGAGFHNEIKMNPMYSKENKGITWGYADNEYNLLHFIQKSIHKISKERYDEFGKIITSKVRQKKTT